MLCCLRTLLLDFYPRPLRGGRPTYKHVRTAATIISIHALCEEGDCPSWAAVRVPKNFYPRPLRGGRRPRSSITMASRISIHALCEEGDLIAAPCALWNLISIHALCEEGDPAWKSACFPVQRFLSTPSARRATSRWWFSAPPARFLSTPSARRATYGPDRLERLRKISIHALCEEGDNPHRQCCGCGNDFYPRPLRGGRPKAFTEHVKDGDFYPRPLRGGRPLRCLRRSGIPGFLSTPSARRATLYGAARQGVRGISIHALCEEGDRKYPSV